MRSLNYDTCTDCDKRSFTKFTSLSLGIFNWVFKSEGTMGYPYKSLNGCFFLFVSCLFLICPSATFSQGVGINTDTPTTAMDVNGDLALRTSQFIATNGDNNNINIGSFSFIRISGPSDVYSITGISNGTDGKFVILFNFTSYDMYINHQDGSSTASNRIICSDNADKVVKQYGCVFLIYSVTDSRWILVSTSNI